jgi:hypothetical protein
MLYLASKRVQISLAAFATVGMVAIATPAAAAADGIARLIAVTQMKANNANDEALEGANKQRRLIREQKSLRATQTTFGTIKATAPRHTTKTCLPCMAWR